MEWATDEAKHARAVRRGREMKRVAGSGDTGKEPVVVPVVVVVVAVHVPLAVPAIEHQVAICGVPSVPLPIEYSPSCI